MSERARLQDVYPEVAAGGYSRVDSTVAFYSRVQAILAGMSDVTVVDLGAGRGKHIADGVAFRRRLRDLRAPDRQVIGIDVDSAVLENGAVDRALVIGAGAMLPLDDASVDVVVSDFTFEHIDDPGWAGRELARVLRPGGWLCVRTPNRWGYIGVGGRVVPNVAHVGILRRLQPAKQERDTFPTQYQLNTSRALGRAFPDSEWQRIVWAVNGEPNYAGRSRLATRAFRTAAVVTPMPLRPMLLAFLRRR